MDGVLGMRPTLGEHPPYPPGCTPEPEFLGFLERLILLAEDDAGRPEKLGESQAKFRALDRLLWLVCDPLQNAFPANQTETTVAHRRQVFSELPRSHVDTGPVDLSRCEVRFIDQTREARHAFLRIASWIVCEMNKPEWLREPSYLGTLPGMHVEQQELLLWFVAAA